MITARYCACGRQIAPRFRKCLRCLDTDRYKVVELRPGNKGRKARGISLTRPDKPRTKRAKGQKGTTYPNSAIARVNTTEPLWLP